MIGRIIDPEIYTQDENMLKGKAQQSDLIYGFSTVWREGNVFGETNSVNYFPMAPLKSENGSQIWYGSESNFLIMNQWSVSSTCSCPEIVARFIDYCYQPVITAQNNQGPIGVALEEQEDGTLKNIVPEGFSTIGDWFVDNHLQQVPRMIDESHSLVYVDPDAADWQDLNGSYLDSQGRQVIGGNQKKVQDAIVGIYCVDFPSVKATEDETAELNLLLPDFNKYVEESLTRFIVRRFVDKADRTTQDEIDRLIAGEAIEKAVRLELTYNEVDKSIDNLWSVLFTTGYLTHAGKTENGRYRLVIPNREVREVFILQIQEWFKEKVVSDSDSVKVFAEPLNREIRRQFANA